MSVHNLPVSYENSSIVFVYEDHEEDYFVYVKSGWLFWLHKNVIFNTLVLIFNTT